MISALVFYIQANSQNLVPNPSFEVLKACPTDEGQVSLASPWQSSLSPDLYNSCATSLTYSVPSNRSCNYLPAQDGNGYMGMWCYFTREMLFTRLLDTLKPGRQYYARFYVATDDDCPSLAQTFSDGIGMGVKGTGPNDNFNIVAENQNGVLYDTSGWTKISGCFRAKGNESVIQIGNFKNNDETILVSNDTVFPLSQQANYLFVDNLLIAPFDPFPDTVLMCNGQPVSLNASFYDATIKWNTGDTTQVYQAVDTGTYIVNATIDGCTFTEKVTIINLDMNGFNPPDTTFCQGDNILLSPGIEGEYLWSNGATTKQLKIESSGVYEATIKNICGEFQFKQKAEAEDCRCRVYVPNIFTPNDDGINDLLQPYLDCDYTYEILHFEVYNRWGGRVWSSPAALAPWDGNLHGRRAPIDTYVWYLTYDIIEAGKRRSIIEKGDVSLIR